MVVFPSMRRWRPRPATGPCSSRGSGPARAGGPARPPRDLRPARRRVWSTTRASTGRDLSARPEPGKLVPDIRHSPAFHAGAAPRTGLSSQRPLRLRQRRSRHDHHRLHIRRRRDALQELHYLSTIPDDAAAGGLLDGADHGRAQRSIRVRRRIAATIRSPCSPSTPRAGASPVRQRSPGGETPRNFNIARADRLYAANQGSDTIVQFRIDAASGQLTPTGDVTQVGAPVCIVFG